MPRPEYEIYRWKGLELLLTNPLGSAPTIFFCYVRVRQMYINGSVLFGTVHRRRGEYYWMLASVQYALCCGILHTATYSASNAAAATFALIAAPSVAVTYFSIHMRAYIYIILCVISVDVCAHLRRKWPGMCAESVCVCVCVCKDRAGSVDHRPHPKWRMENHTAKKKNKQTVSVIVHQ